MPEVKDSQSEICIKPVEMTSNNIYNVISCVVDFFNMDKETACAQIEKYIISRLRFFETNNVNKTVFFVSENEYVETEWKDMVSMHYINTTYKFKNTVMRFHLFSDEQACQESYLGFFTLRSVDEIRIMLSMIYPNWTNIRMENLLYVMTYKKVVHFFGKIFIMNTYPLFVQDMVVAKCAHAAILSATKYLNEKHRLKKVKLTDIINSYTYSRVKVFPATGLSCQQMLEVFDRNNIPITCDELSWDSDYESTDELNILENLKEKFRPTIDSWIESAIPVILGISFKKNKTDPDYVHHVVQIIGHTSGKSRDYVIYDDSGVLGEILLGHRDFVFILSWKQIQEVMKYGDYVIYPQYEKVYMGYDDIKKYLCDYQSELNTNEDFKTKFLKLGQLPSFERARCLIADNVDIKNFLYRQKEKTKLLKEYVNNTIDAIISRNLPHYLWYCEIELSDQMLLVFLANPTYNTQTTKNIFINKEHLIFNENMGLLTRINTENMCV